MYHKDCVLKSCSVVVLEPPEDEHFQEGLGHSGCVFREGYEPLTLSFSFLLSPRQDGISLLLHMLPAIAAQSPHQEINSSKSAQSWTENYKMVSQINPFLFKLVNFSVLLLWYKGVYHDLTYLMMIYTFTLVTHQLNRFFTNHKSLLLH